jgi:hypothetical protein
MDLVPNLGPRQILELNSLGGFREGGMRGDENNG